MNIENIVYMQGVLVVLKIIIIVLLIALLYFIYRVVIKLDAAADRFVEASDIMRGWARIGIASHESATRVHDKMAATVHESAATVTQVMKDQTSDVKESIRHVPEEVVDRINRGDNPPSGQFARP